MSAGTGHIEFNLGIEEGLLTVGCHEEDHPDWFPFHASLSNSITFDRLFPAPVLSINEWGYAVFLPTYFGMILSAIGPGICWLSTRGRRQTLANV